MLEKCLKCPYLTSTGVCGVKKGKCPFKRGISFHWQKDYFTNWWGIARDNEWLVIGFLKTRIVIWF